jgi:hypothetical protein
MHDYNDETEVTWIDGVRYSPRLQSFDFAIPPQEATQLLQYVTKNNSEPLKAITLIIPSKSQIYFAVNFEDGDICFQEMYRGEPKGRDVEIQVQYIGLTSNDSLTISL